MRCLKCLARIVHEGLLPFRTIRRKGFDSGLFRPSLRASLESLDFARDPELVEGRVRKHPVETVRLSSRPKPATKILLCLQVLIHEFSEFVNYAG